MEFYVGVIGAAIIALGFFIALKINKKRTRKKVLEKLGEVGTVKNFNNKAFDCILTIKGIKIFVKVLLLGRTKELSFNSKRHWQVDSTTKKLSLLKTGGFEKLKKPKILLLYPMPETVVKYINENEVVFVQYDEMCFDFYVFDLKEITNIEEVLNKEND